MMTPAEFLTEYPLSSEEQEVIDKANRGNSTELVRLLNQVIRTIAGLRASSGRMSARSATGLLHYHRSKVKAFISLVEDANTRKALKNIFIGDE